MISTSLGGLSLPAHDGPPVRLEDLWRDRPAALIWLRHYGCLYCRAHARAIDRARPEFAAAGIDPVLIGMGTPANAAAFRVQLGLDVPVLADEHRQSYRAVGARMGGVSGLASPRVVIRAVPTILRSRVRQGRTVGHPAQLGASAVIAPGGEVLLHHIARDASDNSTPEALLAAVARVS